MHKQASFKFKFLTYNNSINTTHGIVAQKYFINKTFFYILNFLLKPRYKQNQPKAVKGQNHQNCHFLPPTFYLITRFSGAVAHMELLSPVTAVSSFQVSLRLLRKYYCIDKCAHCDLSCVYFHHILACKQNICCEYFSLLVESFGG